MFLLNFAVIPLASSYAACKISALLFRSSPIRNKSPLRIHERTVRKNSNAISGFMLPRLDLNKSADILHAAYDDASGITAKFNKNILHRINSELGADFDLEQFEHHVVYDEKQMRVGMYLKSMQRQTVSIPKSGIRTVFEKDEMIHTENSFKILVLDSFSSTSMLVASCKKWNMYCRLFTVHAFGAVLNAFIIWYDSYVCTSCEDAIKEDTGADIRVIPDDESVQDGSKCVYCKEPAIHVPLFARGY